MVCLLEIAAWLLQDNNQISWFFCKANQNFNSGTKSVSTSVLVESQLMLFHFSLYPCILEWQKEQVSWMYKEAFCGNVIRFCVVELKGNLDKTLEMFLKCEAVKQSLEKSGGHPM